MPLLFVRYYGAGAGAGVDGGSFASGRYSVFGSGYGGGSGGGSSSSARTSQAGIGGCSLCHGRLGAQPSPRRVGRALLATGRSFDSRRPPPSPTTCGHGPLPGIGGWRAPTGVWGVGMGGEVRWSPLWRPILPCVCRPCCVRWAVTNAAWVVVFLCCSLTLLFLFWCASFPLAFSPTGARR